MLPPRRATPARRMRPKRQTGCSKRPRQPRCSWRTSSPSSPKTRRRVLRVPLPARRVAAAGCASGQPTPWEGGGGCTAHTQAWNSDRPRPVPAGTGRRQIPPACADTPRQGGRWSVGSPHKSLNALHAATRRCQLTCEATLLAKAPCLVGSCLMYGGAARARAPPPHTPVANACCGDCSTQTRARCPAAAATPQQRGDLPERAPAAGRPPLCLLARAGLGGWLPPRPLTSCCSGWRACGWSGSPARPRARRPAAN